MYDYEQIQLFNKRELRKEVLAHNYEKYFIDEFNRINRDNLFVILTYVPGHPVKAKWKICEMVRRKELAHLVFELDLRLFDRIDRPEFIYQYDVKDDKIDYILPHTDSDMPKHKLAIIPMAVVMNALFSHNNAINDTINKLYQTKDGFVNYAGLMCIEKGIEAQRENMDRMASRFFLENHRIEHMGKKSNNFKQTSLDL